MPQQEASRLQAALNQPGMQASIQSHMQGLQASIKTLEQEINDHIDRHPGLHSDVKLITTALRGSRIRRRPCTHQTGAVHARYGGAHAQSFDQHFGQRFKSQVLAPKAVISALMHKLVCPIYGVSKSSIAFNPNFLGNRLDSQDGI